MGAGGEAKESLEGSHRGPSSIEAEGELVEIDLEVVVAKRRGECPRARS